MDKECEHGSREIFPLNGGDHLLWCQTCGATFRATQHEQSSSWRSPSRARPEQSPDKRADMQLFNKLFDRAGILDKAVEDVKSTSAHHNRRLDSHYARLTVVERVVRSMRGLENWADMDLTRDRE